MRTICKRWLAGLLCLAMLGGTLPASAVGLGSDLALKGGSAAYVNPLYADVLTEDDLKQGTPSAQVSTQAISSGDFFTTVEEAGAYLREQMVSRSETIVLGYTTNFASQDLYTQIVDEALAHTGRGNEGDYLAFQWGGLSVAWDTSLRSGTYYHTFTFTVTYYTDAAKEAELDEALEAVLDGLDLYDASDYEKVKGVYNWICHNVTYDYDNLENDSYRLKHTAYAALVNGTAVCQGYAVLLYRMLLELGVDCRIVDGIGNGGAHAWNIVRVSGKWYNLDATWDSSRAEVGLDYDYFLRGEANFIDHTPAASFEENGFWEKYSISQADFDPDQAGSGDDSVDDSGDNSGDNSDDDADDDFVVEEDTSGVIHSGYIELSNLTWKLTENGTLTISGVGEMPRFWDCAPRPWDGLEDKILKVVVEDGVTNVGYCAFYGCYALTDVVLADSVTYVDDKAFYQCTSLKNIQMTAMLTAIGNLSFYLCEDLRKIDLGDQLVSIGMQAFDSCRSLTSIDLPASLSSVGAYAFRSCDGLKAVKFYGEPPVFGNDLVFQGVTATCYYPESSTGWTSSVRKNYGGTLTWTTHDGSTAGGTVSSTSGTCGDALTWTLNDAGVLTVMGTGAMWDYDSWNVEPGWRYENVKTVILLEGVTSIGAYAFYYCDDLANVYISGTVTSIGEYAFYEMKNLTSLSLPEGIQSIGESAFENCSGLTALTIPDSVTQLDSGAFSDCYNVRELVLGSGITAINSDAFYGWTALTSVTIPDSVTSIGSRAFYFCTALEEIVIPDSVTTIGKEAFQLCDSLTRVVLGSSVSYVAEGTFADCTALRSVQLGSSVTGLYSEAFSNCTSLTSITIPASVEKVYSAFPACSALEKIVVEAGNLNFCAVDGVLYTKDMETLVCCPAGKSGTFVVPELTTVIGDYAFYGCSKLTDVILHNDVAKLGQYAFADCAGLTTFTFPLGIDYVATRALIDCCSLRTVYFECDVPRISDDALEGVVAVCYYPADFGSWGYYGSLDVGGYDGVLTWAALDTGHTHSFTSTYMNSGCCTEPNYTLYTCECGESYKAYNSYADEHMFFSCWYSADGTVIYWECVLCGFVEAELLDGAVHTHSYTTETVEPTCTHQGYTAYTCSCGTLYSDLTPVLEHNWSGFVELGGGLGRRTCADCGHWEVFPISGQCGDGLTWRVDDKGTLTISGSGAMWDMDETGYWFGIPITSVVIDEGVTSIGAYAFAGCTSVTSLTIPASVTSIGDFFTDRCPELTQIRVSEASTRYCVKGGILYTKDLTTLVRCPEEMQGTVAVPETVQTVGAGAFAGCISVTRILFAESGLRVIGEEAFAYCNALTEITLPATLAEENTRVFISCNNLRQIHFQGTPPSFASEVFTGTHFLYCYYPENQFYSWRDFYSQFTDFTGCLGGYGFEWYAIHVSHEADETVVSPTCSTDGYTVCFCPDCGTSWIKNFVATAGQHSYSAEIVPPTCTEDGYTVYVCLGCGDYRVGDRVAATGHSWDGGVVTTQPTESKEGVRTYTCKTCGETKTEAIEKLVHTHDYTEQVTAPTCTEQGYTTYTCACGHSYRDDYVSATGHSYGEWYVTVEVSCLNDGEEQRDCKTCGHSETRTVKSAGCPSAKFSDVPANAWYHSYVDFVVEHGLMNGTGGDQFAPTAVVTRATVAQLLYNMEGKPSTSGMSNPFEDVKESDWYYVAVVWAANAGVVSGNGKGGFDPNSNVTREQLAIMLYNYVKYKGYDLEATKDVDLNSFVDGSKTSAWAASQLKWACDLGLIGGKSVSGVTYLAPQDTATRAEIATIFMRFYQMVENS